MNWIISLMKVLMQGQEEQTSLLRKISESRPADAEQDDELLTTKEVVSFTGRSKRTILYWSRKGIIKSASEKGMLKLYRKSDILRAMGAHRNKQ